MSDSDGTEELNIVCVCVLQCFDLDKFEGVSSEPLLVERALKLLEEDRYWAGVVFTDLEANGNDPSDPRPPTHIKYKIRMDIEETEVTNKLKERLDKDTNTQTYSTLKYNT